MPPFGPGGGGGLAGPRSPAARARPAAAVDLSDGANPQPGQEAAWLTGWDTDVDREPRLGPSRRQSRSGPPADAPAAGGSAASRSSAAVPRGARAAAPPAAPAHTHIAGGGGEGVSPGRRQSDARRQAEARSAAATAALGRATAAHAPLGAIVGPAGSAKVPAESGPAGGAPRRASLGVAARPAAARAHRLADLLSDRLLPLFTAAIAGPRGGAAAASSSRVEPGTVAQLCQAGATLADLMCGQAVAEALRGGHAGGGGRGRWSASARRGGTEADDEASTASTAAAAAAAAASRLGPLLRERLSKRLAAWCGTEREALLAQDARRVKQDVDAVAVEVATALLDAATAGRLAEAAEAAGSADRLAAVSRSAAPSGEVAGSGAANPAPVVGAERLPVRGAGTSSAASLNGAARPASEADGSATVAVPWSSGVSSAVPVAPPHERVGWVVDPGYDRDSDSGAEASDSDDDGGSLWGDAEPRWRGAASAPTAAPTAASPRRGPIQGGATSRSSGGHASSSAQLASWGSRRRGDTGLAASTGGGGAARPSRASRRPAAAGTPEPAPPRPEAGWLRDESDAWCRAGAAAPSSPGAGLALSSLSGEGDDGEEEGEARQAAAELASSFASVQSAMMRSGGRGSGAPDGDTAPGGESVMAATARLAALLDSLAGSAATHASDSGSESNGEDGASSGTGGWEFERSAAARGQGHRRRGV